MDSKWIKRFLEAAEHRATFSKDPSTKVGSVCVGPDGKSDISYGYNGFAKGVADINLHDRQYKYDRTIHAELNAILNAKRDLDRCYLFCTLAPCHMCANAIVQSGIKTVYHIQENFELNDRWIGSHLTALDIFSSAGVDCYGVCWDGSLITGSEQVERIEERRKHYGDQ